MNGFRQIAKNPVWLDVRWLAVLLIVIYGVFVLAPPGTSWPFHSRDLPFIWGGAVRIAMGQIPHEDFLSPLGFLFFWPAAQLVKMHLPPDRAFAVSYSFFNMLAVAMAVFFTRGEQNRWLRVLLVLAAFSTAGSLIDNVFELRPDYIVWRQIATGTFYSSYRPLAAGFLGLILFRFFYQPPAPSQQRDTIDGVLLGALAVLLLFIKASYAVMGCLPVLAMLILFPVKRRLIITAAITALVLLAALEWGGHHYLSNYIQDILVVVKTGGRIRLGHFLPVYAASRAGILSFFLLALASFVLWKSGGRTSWRMQILLFVCLISNILICQYDTCGPHLVAYMAALIGLGQWLAAQTKITGNRNTRVAFFLCEAFIVLLILARFDVHIQSLFYYGRESIAGQNFTLARLKAFDTSKEELLLPRLSTFHPYYDACMKQHPDYDFCYHHFLADAQTDHHPDAFGSIQYVQSAADLLERVRKREDIHDLLVLDFVNPFDALLGITPAKGLPLWLDGTTLSGGCYAKPERFFSRVDYILEPLFPLLTLYVGDLKNYYGAYMKENFVVLDRNQQFILWKRSRPAEITVSRYDCQRPS